MALVFAPGPANCTWNSGSTATTFAVGNFITQFVAGRLYIAFVSGDSVPSSLTSTLDITWSLIVAESSPIGGHAVWVGIATASAFGTVTTVTFPSASVGAFGGIDEVSGITDDGANGTLLVTRHMTEYVAGVTHSFDFSPTQPTWGYWIGSMMHNSTAAETFTSNSGGWTATDQAFRAGIPTFTPPFFNFQADGKLNPTQPIGGTWSVVGGGEQSYGVALEIVPVVAVSPYWGILTRPG